MSTAGGMRQHTASILELEGVRTTRQPEIEDSLEAAGWSRAGRVDVGRGPFDTLRWSNLRTIVAARAQTVVGLLARDDVSGAMREAWQEVLGRRPVAGEPVCVPRRAPAGSASRVLLLGDTGDGSEAQRAVAEHVAGRLKHPGVALQAPADGVAAVLIESDIVYPSGAADEFAQKFHTMYEPVHDAGVPIFAVPGNHDWNDGSNTGFMTTFCGASGRPPEVDEARRASFGGGWRKWLARAFWRHVRPDAPAPPWRAAPAPQPGPYLALDIDGVLFVGVDTGFGATIDERQAQWLIDTVEGASNQPKVLFSGKPLIVNGGRDPVCFAAAKGGGTATLLGQSGRSYRSIDDVVRCPEHCFVVVAGGDIHNYQRYLAEIRRVDGDARELPYLVVGGGGVFVAQTYWLPRIAFAARDEPTGDEIGVDEKQIVLFPTRAHSRLVFDQITRQARSRARFTLPIGLAAAAVVAAAEQIPGSRPNWLAVVAIVCAGVAVNIGTRPIERSGWSCSGVVAVLGGLAAAAAVERPLGSLSERGSAWLLAGALLGGAALLELAELEHLRGSPRRRRLATGISAIAALLVAGGALGTLDAAFPSSHDATWSLIAVVVISLLVTAVATRAVFPRYSPQHAADEMLAELDRTRDRRHGSGLRVRASRWLTRRQKLFSIYQTFTDGRLETRARLRVHGVARPLMPLYRSLLEIEFRRLACDGDDWDFVFTTHAVTGEATIDSGGEGQPVIVDSFWVQVRGGRLARVVTEGPPPTAPPALTGAASG